MPSPFPGMNPYLETEDAWHDFHKSFMPQAAELLNAQVGAEYIVKIEEHVYVHDLSDDQQSFAVRADVVVTPAPDPRSPGPTARLLEAPAEVRVPPLVDEGSESFLELRDRRSRQLVTVIELLSPANKDTGPDRNQYIAKRNQLLASRVHFIELDLLRGGPRMPWVGLPECDYYALVSRAERRPWAGAWPLRLRDRLPVIPVPLRAPDPDVRLDLQAVLHRIYDTAGYERFIYDSDPVPHLAPDDAAWARQFVPPRP